MILTNAEYLDKINILFADNSTQEISPLDLRTSLVDLVDSIGNIFTGTELDSSNFSTPDTRTTRRRLISQRNVSRWKVQCR